MQRNGQAISNTNMNMPGYQGGMYNWQHSTSGYGK